MPKSSARSTRKGARADEGEAAEHAGGRRSRPGRAAGREETLEQEDRNDVHRGEFRDEGDSEGQGRPEQGLERRRPPQVLPGENGGKHGQRGAEVRVHDARVRDHVRVEGEERHGEEGRARPVARPGPEEHGAKEERQEHEKRRPRRGRDRVRRDGAFEEERVAEIGEGVPHRDALGRRRQRQGRQREAGEHFHERRVLDVHDPVLEGDVAIAGKDVHRLIGGERVPPRVVVNEKKREARGNERREDDRAPPGYVSRRGLRRGASVWRASAASAENPSHSRIFLPSAIERPK